MWRLKKEGETQVQVNCWLCTCDGQRRRERSAGPQDAVTSCWTAQKIWTFHPQWITETTHETHFADTKTVPEGLLPWACDILD